MLPSLRPLPGRGRQPPAPGGGSPGRIWRTAASGAPRRFPWPDLAASCLRRPAAAPSGFLCAAAAPGGCPHFGAGDDGAPGGLQRPNWCCHPGACCVWWCVRLVGLCASDGVRVCAGDGTLLYVVVRRLVALAALSAANAALSVAMRAARCPQMPSDSYLSLAPFSRW